jgi:hypothetical protein
MRFAEYAWNTFGDGMRRDLTGFGRIKQLQKNWGQTSRAFIAGIAGRSTSTGPPARCER